MDEIARAAKPLVDQWHNGNAYAFEGLLPLLRKGLEKRVEAFFPHLQDRNLEIAKDRAVSLFDDMVKRGDIDLYKCHTFEFMCSHAVRRVMAELARISAGRKR